MGFGGAPNFPATRLREFGNVLPAAVPGTKSEHISHVVGPPYKGVLASASDKARKPAAACVHYLTQCQSKRFSPLRPTGQRVQSLPEKLPVLCPPGTCAFLGAFFMR
jgi:hypothetical protein